MFRRDHDVIEEKKPRNRRNSKESADESDKSLSDFISENGGATDSISMNEDERKEIEPSTESPGQGEVDNAPGIPDATPKTQPLILPVPPKTVKKAKKVCVRQ